MNKAIMPGISLYFEQATIMIHKTTMKLLGMPEYVQLLINPTNNNVMLCTSNSEDYLALHINNKTKTYRLHSKKLLDEFKRLVPEFGSRSSWKIYGQYISELNVIKFDIKEVVCKRNTEDY